MDRRIQKTRKALQDALLNLLRDTPMEKIEIQAITDEANTARVTFYRHYGTKEELLIDATESIYQELKPQIAGCSFAEIIRPDVVQPLCLLFEFLEQDRALHKTLLTGSTSALIQRRLREIIVGEVMEKFRRSPEFAGMPVLLIANQMASVAIGNVMWWLADDLPYSVDYMANMTHWMGISGALTIIGRSDLIQLPDYDLSKPGKLVR